MIILEFFRDFLLRTAIVGGIFLLLTLSFAIGAMIGGEIGVCIGVAIGACFTVTVLDYLL